MKLPQFCYEKAFWLILPILIISTASGISAINAQLESLDTRIRENEIELANNDVPTLKAQIKDGFDKMDHKLDTIRDQNINLDKQNKKLEAQGELQIKLFCIAHNDLCP